MENGNFFDDSYVFLDFAKKKVKDNILIWLISNDKELYFF
jgi:hypothetical protein